MHVSKPRLPDECSQHKYYWNNCTVRKLLQQETSEEFPVMRDINITANRVLTMEGFFVEVYLGYGYQYPAYNNPMFKSRLNTLVTLEQKWNYRHGGSMAAIRVELCSQSCCFGIALVWRVLRGHSRLYTDCASQQLHGPAPRVTHDSGYLRFHHFPAQRI